MFKKRQKKKNRNFRQQELTNGVTWAQVVSAPSSTIESPLRVDLVSRKDLLRSQLLVLTDLGRSESVMWVSTYSLSSEWTESGRLWLKCGPTDSLRELLYYRVVLVDSQHNQLLHHSTLNACGLPVARPPSGQSHLYSTQYECAIKKYACFPQILIKDISLQR